MVHPRIRWLLIHDQARPRFINGQNSRMVLALLAALRLDCLRGWSLLIVGHLPYSVGSDLRESAFALSPGFWRASR